MYCVTCGSLLRSENQAGIVCHLCKQARAEKRRREKRPISIRYCFRCGQSYQPHDTSIQHRFCSSEPVLSLHSSGFLSEKDITSEARKDTHVLLSLVLSEKETPLV